MLDYKDPCYTRQFFIQLVAHYDFVASFRIKLLDMSPSVAPHIIFLVTLPRKGDRKLRERYGYVYRVEMKKAGKLIFHWLIVQIVARQVARGCYLTLGKVLKNILQCCHSCCWKENLVLLREALAATKTLKDFRRDAQTVSQQNYETSCEDCVTMIHNAKIISVVIKNYYY